MADRKNKHAKRTHLDSNTENVESSDLVVRFSLMMLLFVMCVAIIYVIWITGPQMSGDDKDTFYSCLPGYLSKNEFQKLTDTDNIKQLVQVISKYKQSHWRYIVTLLSLIYLLFQSFPIFCIWLPGTASLITVILGSLFNAYFSIFLCSILSTVGPTLAYVIFDYGGKPIVMKMFREQVHKIEALYNEYTDQDYPPIRFIIFLRVSPLFPNFLVNITSPVIGVKIKDFMIGTFCGLFPNSIILVSMGASLATIQSLNYGPYVFLLLLLLGFAALYVPRYL